MPIPTRSPAVPFASALRASGVRQLGVCLLLSCSTVLAADPPASASDWKAAGGQAQPANQAKPSAEAKEIGDQVRAALQGLNPQKSSMPLVIDSKEKKIVPGPVTPRKPPPQAAISPSQQYQRARAIAHGLPVPPLEGQKAAANPHKGPWRYDGVTGPEHWSKLRPDYHLCAAGHRQSPIAIEEGSTLLGPAEPIRFNYQPSQGTITHNGHTIQVDVTGENSLTVRSTTYRLEQFHFHHPAEEQIKQKRFAMSAHLVHRSQDGQLAVLAILLDPGVPNPLIDKVWTYIPLDEGDRVRIPAEQLNLNELLPKDQRYYQYIGSLTTPPCQEGVLWLVLKQPMTVSHAQLRLLAQLFPNNARPVQPVHGRPVREAQ